VAPPRTRNRDATAVDHIRSTLIYTIDFVLFYLICWLTIVGDAVRPRQSHSQTRHYWLRGAATFRGAGANRGIGAASDASRYWLFKLAGLRLDRNSVEIAAIGGRRG
jgi:hypothetical protein